MKKFYMLQMVYDVGRIYTHNNDIVNLKYFHCYCCIKMKMSGRNCDADDHNEDSPKLSTVKEMNDNNS